VTPSADDIQERVTSCERSTQASLNEQNEVLTEVKARLEENARHTPHGNSVGESLLEHINCVQKFGSDLKCFLDRIVFGNIAIYNELLRRGQHSKQY
jgi:hypothetical protein